MFKTENEELGHMSCAYSNYFDGKDLKEPSAVDILLCDGAYVSKKGEKRLIMLYTYLPLKLPVANLGKRPQTPFGFEGAELVHQFIPYLKHLVAKVYDAVLDAETNDLVLLGEIKIVQIISKGPLPKTWEEDERFLDRHENLGPLEEHFVKLKEYKEKHALK